MGDFVKKLGLLGGTFDPIHFGHLHLGISLQEAHHLDEVIVCPAFHSPLKPHQPEEAKHRLAIVKLAIEGLPTWRVLDWEITRPHPSYTIDTVRHLLEVVYANQKVELHLLLGEDLLPDLPKWKEIDRLLELAPPLVGCRRYDKNSFQNPFAQKIAKGMTTTKVLEISASEIRERLKKGLYCGHLVPAKVLDYITKHRLY